MDDMTDAGLRRPDQHVCHAVTAEVSDRTQTESVNRMALWPASQRTPPFASIESSDSCGAKPPV